MPLTYNADGTLETEPVGDRGARQPTEANRDALGVNDSGEQTIRRLGPYRVNHDDTDLGAAGFYEERIRVGDPLPVGALVQAWIVMIEGWDNLGTSPAINLDVYGPHGGGADTPGVLGEAVHFVSDPSFGYGDQGGSSGYGIAVQDASTAPLWFVPRDELTLVVKINTGAGATAPTQGKLDVYLLIAEPV